MVQRYDSAKRVPRDAGNLGPLVPAIILRLRFTELPIKFFLQLVVELNAEDLPTLPLDLPSGLLVEAVVMRQMGKKGGKAAGGKGGRKRGRKRMAALSSEERKELARKGAKARWAKKDEQSTQ